MKQNLSICNLQATEGRILGSEMGSLGTVTELRTPPMKTIDLVDKETGEVLAFSGVSDTEKVLDARKLRYELQSISSNILYGYHPDGAPINSKGYEVHHRTCTCHVFRLDNKVSVLKSSEHNKAFFGGLMTCANARTCPVCASPINERKANEMRTAFNQHEALGLNVSMLTFTAPHTAQDSIEDLTDKISKALSHFWRGAPAKRFKEKYGIIGHIRSFEVRYGSNGWHPHFHILIFSKHKLPITKKHGYRVSSREFQNDSWNWILDRWQNMCVKSGLNLPNEYGMDIQDADNAGAYITKFGSDGDILATASGKEISWDMADEMTKGNAKIGVTGSLSPWDILAQVRDADTKENKTRAKLLFLSYARAMAGVSLVKWSRGLRSIFSLDEKEATDEEILSQQDDKADLLCFITAKEWKYIHFNKLRPMILQLVESGGRLAVARFLHAKTSSGSFDVYYSEFIQRDNDNAEIEFSSLGDRHSFGVDGQRTLEVKKTLPRELKKIPNYKYIDV